MWQYPSGEGRAALTSSTESIQSNPSGEYGDSGGALSSRRSRGDEKVDGLKMIHRRVRKRARDARPADVIHRTRDLVESRTFLITWLQPTIPAAPPSPPTPTVLATLVFQAPPSTADPSTGDDYSRDLLAYLRQRELHTPCKYLGQSPQLNRRRYLVDWTSVVAEKLELSRVAVHLAIRIVDFFMDRHDIQELQLHLVCLTALLIATKFEEKDSKVPKISALSVFLNDQFLRKDFQSLEAMILTFLNFSLAWPTVAHFVDLILPFAMDKEDYLNNDRIRDYNGAKDRFSKFVEYFLDISLQDEYMVSLAPSIVASSVLYCSRVALSLSPEWPQHLVDLTGGQSLAIDDMVICSNRLLAVYDHSMNLVTPPRKHM